MNTPRKLCQSCHSGMSFASYFVPALRMKVTGWHCAACSTVTERCANLDVVRAG